MAHQNLQLNQTSDRLRYRRWIITSFVVSAAVFVWAVTMPLRGKTVSVESNAELQAESQATRTRQEEVELTLMKAEAIRAKAREMDRKLMRDLRRRREEREARNNVRNTPVQQAFAEYQGRVFEQVEQLREAPTHSLEGQYRDQLLEQLNDSPR
ncbi:hypothetical protein SH139x_001379 [Planctomycetaceae bacterium SH139]